MSCIIHLTLTRIDNGAKLGLLDAETLPVAGKEVAQKVLNPFGVPSNTLMERWKESEGKSLE